MAIQITIVGLGKIGTSIGLALGDNPDILRMGFDDDDRNARTAEKMGALDRKNLNLHTAVQDADIVLLCIPTDQIQETIESISKDMRKGALLLETGLVKEATMQWVETFLHEGQNYIGLTPITNAQYLHKLEIGTEAAQADLFQGCLMGMVTLPGTSSEILGKAENLVRLLGAVPFYSEPLEIDGLVAATRILPQLMAAAFVNSTQEQPGWNDGQKIAGEAYAAIGELVYQFDDQNALTAAVMHNKQNVSRMIGFVITTLQTIQDDILDNNDQDLNQKLGKAQTGLKAWWRQRSEIQGGFDAVSTSQLPSSRDAFRNLFGFRPGPKKPTRK